MCLKSFSNSEKFSPPCVGFFVEYAKGAQDFLNNPPKGTLTKVRQDGDVVRYNESSGEYASMSKAGKIKTYMKPSPRSLENPKGFKQTDKVQTTKDYFYEY